MDIKFDRVDKVMHMADSKVKLIDINKFSSKDDVLLPLLSEKFWKCLKKVMLQIRGGECC